MRRLLPIATVLLPLALPAQQDDAFQRSYDAWEQQQRAFTDAALAARRGGQIEKGGALPADVQQLQERADAARAALLTEFGQRDVLPAAAYRLLGRVHESARDYGAAVGAYTKALAHAPTDTPDFDTLGKLCLAAMNSKDDRLAARWMRTLLDAEDRHAPTRRNLQVRTSWYPRMLIALGDWETLEQHVTQLAGDDDAASTTAAATFGVVAKIHRGDLEGAANGVAAIRAEPERFPDQQAWAVLAQIALDVHRGEFDAAAKLARECAAEPTPVGTSPIDRNQRRYVAAIAPFLGEPAPQLRVDTWVGGEIAGADVLAALRGKVVVLDFWQPWCEPCRKAMPKLVQAQRDHGDQVTVLGLCKVENYGYDVSARAAVRPIAPADYPAHVADFHADMQLNYPLAIADTAANNESYRVAGIPTLVIIDRDGIVRWMSCGAGEPGLFELALQGVLRATR